MKRDTTALSIQELEQEVNKIQSEDLSQYPSMFQMGRNLIKQGWLSAVGMAKGQPLLAAPEKASARLEICNACEFFDIGPQRCKKCGCYMASKANLEHSACPISKWGELQTIPVSDSMRLQSGSVAPQQISVTASLPPYPVFNTSGSAATEFQKKLDGSLLKNFSESEKIDFMTKYESSESSGSATFTVRNITFTILGKQG